MQDLHNRLQWRRGISPAAAVTDNTPFVSEILDTDGWGAAEFLWLSGSIADADVTFVVLMEESNASDMSGSNAVADEDLLGTESGAAPLFGSDNKGGKLGYAGSKRYIRVTITPSNNTGNIFLCGGWLQAFPQRPAASSQIV